MDEVADALAGNFYIATTDGNQPHVRPFDNAVNYEGELYIGTNNTKKVYEQIKNNPNVEIFSMEHGTIRFTAKAFPVEDEELNKTIFELLDKNYDETSVAVELKNIEGTLISTMGDKTNIKLNLL